MWKCNRHDWRVKVIHRNRVPSAPLGKKARCSPGVWHGVICVNTLLCVCTNTYIYANRCTTFYIFLREKVHLFPIPELPCDKLWPMTCSWIDTVYVPGLRFKGSVSSALVLLLVWPHHLKKPHTHTQTHYNFDSVMKGNKIPTASTTGSEAIPDLSALFELLMAADCEWLPTT